nr:unnamed protein product [Spirometra erinaceieuropaei]
MTRTTLRNQIEDLAERLDELNRITRICAMGTPFEETRSANHHVLPQVLSDKEDLPLADHFSPRVCALQSSSLGRPFEPYYGDTAEDGGFSQSHITCLNSLERMPDSLVQSPQASHSPPSRPIIKPICDAHILQSEELLKLQERQFNLQDHLMELMHRVQHRECPSKSTSVREAGLPVREHDIDEHVKVLKTTRPPGTQLKSANRKSTVPQRTTKHPAPLSRNNNAVVSPDSRKSRAWSSEKQGRLQTAAESSDEKRSSAKATTERDVHDRTTEEIPLDMKSLATSSPQCDQEDLVDGSDLQEIKKELALLRETFGKELEDVRNFLQENREEIEQNRRTTLELKSTKEEKENFQPEAQSTYQQLNISNGSHRPTEDAVTGLQPPPFRYANAPPPLNSTLIAAHKALREVEQRRNNLETNISAFERSRKCQGFFDILDMLGKDEDAVERARIKAMVDDAISGVRDDPQTSRTMTATSTVRRPVDDAQRRLRGRGAGVGVRGRGGNVVKHVSISPVRPPKPPTLASIISASPPQKPLLQFAPSTHSKSPEPKATPAMPAGRFEVTSAPLSGGALRVPQHQRRPRPIQDAVSTTRKAVRFDDGIMPNLELPGNNLEHPVRPRPPPRRRAIQPLGMRQYSMCPIEQSKPPAKPAQDDSHLDQIGTGLIFNHLSGIDPPKASQPSVTEVHPTDSMLQRRTEEEVVSRLLRQLALAFSQPQAQATTPLVSTTRAPNLRDLVEAALLERVAQGDLLTPPPQAATEPCREHSPDPSIDKSPTVLESSHREPATEDIGENSTKAISSTSTAPPQVSVCDRSASARPLSSPSTLTSLPRRQLSQHSRAISVQSLLQRVEEKPSEHSAQNAASVTVDENEDRTLDEQPPLPLSGTTSPLASLARPHLSMQSEAVPPHESAMAQSPALVSDPCEPPRTPLPVTAPSPTLTPPSTSTAAVGEEATVSPPSNDIATLRSPERRPSAGHPSSYSSTLSEGPSSEWSLTAPHSFSDGVWLEERSEGEAAHYSLCPSTAAKLGPLPLTDSQELDSAGSEPKEADRSNSTDTLSCGELTAEKLTKRNSAWVAPWRNPLLHLMALNAAGSSSRLPWNRFVEVQRTAAALRSHQLRRRQAAGGGGGDATQTTPTPMASDLRWLKETLTELETDPTFPRRHSDPETSDVLSAGEIKSDFVGNPNELLYSNVREPFLQARGDTKKLISESRPLESVKQGDCKAEEAGGIVVHADTRLPESVSDTATGTNNSHVSYDEDFEPQENCNCATDTSGEGTKRSLLLAVQEFSDDDDDDENEDENEVYEEANEEKQIPEDPVSSNNDGCDDPCVVGDVSPGATSVTTTQWASVSREGLPCHSCSDMEPHLLLPSTARDSFPETMEEEASGSPPPPSPQLISTPRLFPHQQSDADQALLMTASRHSSGDCEGEEKVVQRLGEQAEFPNESLRLDAECLRLSTPPESLLEATDLPSTEQLLDNALRQTISLSSSFADEEVDEGVNKVADSNK